MLSEEHHRTSNSRKVAGSTRASTAPSPYSPHKRAAAATVDGRGSVSAPTDAGGRDKTASRGRCRGNPVLEGEAQRLAKLKRRQAMELQQMLAYELRCLARDVRHRDVKY